MPHHPHTARLLRAALAFSLETGLRSWACFVLLSSHLRGLYLQVLVTQCNSLTLTFMLVSLSVFLSALHTTPQRKPHWSFSPHGSISPTKMSSGRLNKRCPYYIRDAVYLFSFFLLVSLIFAIIFFISFSFISDLVFMISFLLLTLGVLFFFLWLL